MKPTDWIWQDGEWKSWTQATVHVMAHGLNYGSTVFEGIRAYQTPAGPALFRLREHLQRLSHSCKMYQLPLPFDINQLETACRELVTKNGLGDAYLRPLVYRDVAGLGLAPAADDPVGVAIAAIEWGPLLGKDSVDAGVHLCVSSWTRLQSASNPVMAKAGGHYLTSQLISSEARRNGYDDGIAVNRDGIVTEGAGANLFMVKNGKVFTPSQGVFHLGRDHTRLRHPSRPGCGTDNCRNGNPSGSALHGRRSFSLWNGG